MNNPVLLQASFMWAASVTLFAAVSAVVYAWRRSIQAVRLDPIDLENSPLAMAGILGKKMSMLRGRVRRGRHTTSGHPTALHSNISHHPSVVSITSVTSPIVSPQFVANGPEAC